MLDYRLHNLVESNALSLIYGKLLGESREILHIEVLISCAREE